MKNTQITLHAVTLVMLLFAPLLFFGQTKPSSVDINFCSLAKEDSIISHHFELATAKNFDRMDTVALKSVNGIYSLAKAKRFISYYYFSKQQARRGFTYFNEYVALGGELRHYTYDQEGLLSNYLDSLSTLYDKRSTAYEESLNAELREFVQQLQSDDQSVRVKFNDSGLTVSQKDELLKGMRLVDSVNIHLLDSLVFCCGWPTRKELGYSVFSPNPDIVVLHASESKKLEYYNIVRSSIFANNEYPSILGSIATMTFFKHRINRFSKLRFVNFKKASSACENEFIIKNLSKLCLDNNDAIQFFLTNMVEDEKKDSLQQYFTDKLIAFGMSPDDISIIESNEAPELASGKDEFGDYFVVFKLVRN